MAPAPEAVAESLSADEQRVRDWRWEQFVALGFGHAESDLLADCADVDLGRVRTIVGAGCDHRTALRIVL
jgi:hypothetical protein